MKKTLSKIISVTLCVALMFTVTACDNKNVSSTASTTTKKTIPVETRDEIDTVDTADETEIIDTANDTDTNESESDLDSETVSKTEEHAENETSSQKKTTKDSDSEKATDTNTETKKTTSSESNTDTNTNTDSEKDGISKSENTDTLRTKSLSTESEETQYEPELREYDHYDNWIWVGDSRTVGMAGNVGITYLAKSAMGLDWFSSVANELYDLEGYNIILNFGINDYWNVTNYANFYNNMPDKLFEKNKVFVMAVNPVDEIKQVYYGYGSSNATLEWFNENLKNNLRSDIEFIDSYTYLMNTGFDTIDGIHYDGNTNIKIYNFMVETITYKKD